MASFPTTGDDVIFGTDNADTIDALAGDDLVVGGAGNDRLTGGFGDDMLAGGFGLDTLIGGRGGSDTAFYGFYSDDVRADLALGVGYIMALGQAADADTFFNIENISGGFGDDELRGDIYANRISGSSGDDILDGREGDDTLNGGIGNDDLFGGSGTDILIGGAGNDFVRGGPGGDTMSGGEGTDTLDYLASTGAVTISLLDNSASGGDANGDIISGVENVIGTAHGDKLTGSDGANVLFGADGADTIDGLGGIDNLRGGNGSDTLRGGAGDDTLDGMAGIDRLNGGGGADRYFFTAAGDSGVGSGQRDVIAQFQQGQDGIYITFDAVPATAAFEDFEFIGNAAFSPGVAGQVRYTSSGAKTIISFNTDTDSTAEFQIEIEGKFTLTDQDLFL